jgi:uncharacterized membrane protein
MNSNIFIIILSLLGLWVSFSIMEKKKTKNCGRFCNYEVISSKYSQTFGIENTILGSLYYGAMIAAHLIFWFWPTILPVNLLELAYTSVFGAALLAAVFSLYLVAIQFFVLKKLCPFCLMTAVINIILAILTLP